MYADFFLDRLCESAPVLRLFKQGLEAIEPDWPEINLQADKLDDFAIAKSFFDTLYHNFDTIELHYICNALYAQAGAVDSINYITKVCGEENISIVATEQLLPTGRFYDIHVDCPTEYVNNLQFFKQRLESLVRDLLYYNGCNIGLYSLSFECEINNQSYLSEQTRILNDKYAFLPANILSNPDLFVIADLGVDNGN